MSTHTLSWRKKEKNIKTFWFKIKSVHLDNFVNQNSFLPVTMTVLMFALLSTSIIGVVSGFSLFSITSKPRNVRFFSTISLKTVKPRIN